MSEVHTAAIIAFPARIAPARIAPTSGQLGGQIGQRGQFCGILYVARQLRLEAVDLRTVVSHIRAHVQRSGFPQPVTSRLRHGLPIQGADAVSPKSEWLRASVDAWVQHRHSASLTPAAGAALAETRAAQVDQLLAARLLRAAHPEPIEAAPQDPAA